MSNLRNPFDPGIKLTSNCSCGSHASQEEHDRVAPIDCVPRGEEAVINRVVESALVRALFKTDESRRRFLKAVGASTALAALSSVFPLGMAQAFANEAKGPLEKKNLKIGFVPITCATPLIMAGPMGFYEEQGLNVTLIKTAGWALVRDNMLNKEVDASHMLSPMPLAISMGAGSVAQPMKVATIQNINGQAITLHVKHKDKRDPKQWKGMRFAVPFDYSMHNFLLRYYVAEHGLDPDKDIEIRLSPPPEMVANLRAGNIDGFLGPDPFNQRAVFEGAGFIHILSKDIWEGHPCCAFGVSSAFVTENPNTFAALFRAMLNAAEFAHQPQNRSDIAKAIAPANYLNQPVTVIEQVLSGRFADGLGKVQEVPARIDFAPFPWQSMAVWILTQMKRWGYIQGDVNYQDIAEQVFLVTDARKYMTELGVESPEQSYAKATIMGKEFDPAKPEDYVASFAIKRV